MSKNTFFVRVKRSRDDDPVENLCIVEDAAPAKKRSMRDLDQQLASLSSNPDTSAPVIQPKRLLLSRVKTLRFADDALIHTAPSEEGTTAEQPLKRKREPTKVVVTSGKKTVASETTDSFVIIDMAQLVTKSQRVEPALAVATAAPASKVPVSRILDPATRMLDRGIIQAMKNGDFNDISSALMQGANADHQTAAACTTLGAQTSSGCTALMAATLHCNIRVVKRLLTKGVDVTKQNSDGATALDLLKLTARNMKDGLEIQALIQNALLKVSQAPSMRAAIVRENIRLGHDGFNTSSSGAASEMDTDDNFVYDIYCVDTSASDASAAPAPSTPTSTPDPSASTSEEPSTAARAEEAYSVVRVEGLRILENGEVDLMMAYDSDWSDLGDDEDPDSNDERFHGNDYPEDEENEGEELVDTDEEYEHFKAQAAATLPPKLRPAGGVTPLPGGAGRGRGQGSGPAAGSRARVPLVRPPAEESDSEDEAGARRVRFAPKGMPAGGPSRGSGGLFAPGTPVPAKMRKNGSKGGNMGFDDLLAQEEAFEAGADESAEEEEGPATNGYDSDECDVYGNPLKSAFKETDQNSDYDFDADEDGKNEHEHEQGVPLKLSSDRDLLYGDDDNLPAFERRYGVGKVLRPQLLGGSGGAGGEDAFAQQGLYEAPHTTESLQELWGEVEGNREDYNGQDEDGRGSGGRGGDRGGSGGGGGRVSGPGGPSGDEHGDRLQHMRQRTGMVFAAAPREFDASTGLAKYGAELSDDDDEMMHTDGRIEYVGGASSAGVSAGSGAGGAQGAASASKLHAYRPSNRPPLDTVAYDSELDGSD